MKRETFQPRSFTSLVLAVGAGAVFAAIIPMVGLNHAEAGPPAPSALSIQQRASTPDPQDALDAGKQRLELVDELRALRSEVAELKALLTSGRVRTSVTNLAEIPLDKIRLEIDYVKLRDALKGN